jgi:hypothetical protein
MVDFYKQNDYIINKEAVMKTQNREYWQTISEELEEAVSEDLENGIYDVSKIPDLEELAMHCPYKDLSKELLDYARRIECGLVKFEAFEEMSKNYIDICFDL